MNLKLTFQRLMVPNIEPSQLICRKNQLPCFYITGSFVIEELTVKTTEQRRSDVCDFELIY